MKGRWTTALAAAAVTTVCAATPAAAQTWAAQLAGSQEVPPVATAGTGFAFVSIVGNTLTVNASFSGLTGTTTASHIHCCAPIGTNAGVATQTPSFVGFPLGVTAGTFNGSFDLTLASSYNPAFITANGGTVASARAVLVAGMLAGQTYFNVHTSAFPGGEIRGQLAVVPEPGTYALLGTGLAGLAAVARRRRRATA